MNKTPSEMTQQELYLEIARLSNENDKLKRTKKFGLVWENKNDAKVEEVRRSAPILVEDSSKRVINDPNDVNHILINGDNFQAMTALRATHAGKVDVIYIDPPYNTGNKDFIYNDKFVDAEDGYRHSLWLSFMQKRLILAKELLSETGVIFVSIDDNEQARLKLLMDDIFGAENFVDTLVISNLPSGRSLAKFFANNHEYVFVFAKDIHQTLLKPELATLVDSSAYKLNDNGGQYRLTSLVNSHKEFGPHNRPNLHYPLYVNQETGEVFVSQNDLGTLTEVLPKLSDGTLAIWTWGKPKSNDEKDLLIAKVRAGKISVYRKDYLTVDKKTRLRSFLDHKIMGLTSTAGKNLESILGHKKFYGVKPVDYIKTLVASMPKNNAIVLDFFAGSGTTAHAVAELNKEDGGRRQCILVTDGGKAEETGESSKNSNEETIHIAEEITYERVRRVLTGKDWADGKEHEPLGGNLFYLNTVMKYVGTIDAKSKEPYFCPSNSTAFSLDTGVWHPILEEVGESAEWPFQKRDYKLFALPKGEDGKQNYALTINTSDWEFTAFKEWFDKNMPEDSTVFLYADSFSHAGCEWMEELEMVKDPRLAEVNITKRLINNHKWVAHSFLKTDI